jgi:hypothetical protein
MRLEGFDDRSDTGDRSLGSVCDFVNDSILVEPVANVGVVLPGRGELRRPQLKYAGRTRSCAITNASAKYANSYLELRDRSLQVIRGSSTSSLPPQRFFGMKVHRYDIVRQEEDKSAIWLEAVSDVNTAESRIQELASFWPGEFWVMDQQSHQIVARVNGLLSQRLRRYDKSNA